MGSIPLSKEMYLHGCIVSACNLLVKLETGTKINREIIKIVAIKANITYPLYFTSD